MVTLGSMGLRVASVFLAAMISLSALIPTAYADESDRRRGGRVVARQNRAYRLVHEFDIGVGILPLDALYTGVSLGGSYTLHLSDLLALELIDFRYSLNIDSGLRNRLSDEFEVSPTVTPEVEYIAGTGLLFTPFFGKFALFNRDVVHVATHFGLNGGVAHFTDGFRFQISGGPGLRFFANNTLSSRLDVRGTVAFDDTLSFETLLQISLSFAFNFGSVRATGSTTDTREQVDPYEVLNELYPETQSNSPDDEL